MSFGKQLKDIAGKNSIFLLKNGCASNLRSFFDETYGLFNDEECVILTCGPSLNDYDTQTLKEKLEGKLVFCVKQALSGLEDTCDVHFYNCSNLPKQKYSQSSQYLTVASSNYPVGFRLKNTDNMDIFIKVPLIEEIGGRHKTLSHMQNFDDYLFSNTLERNVGPGIMLESVIYFAVNLGVKSITTLGWDLNAHGSHFYTSEVNSKGCEIPWDIHQNLMATEGIFNWLRSKDISLKTYSKNNNLYKQIERIKL